MDMDQAAVFLAGSILTALGFIAIVIGLVVINNIIARYWKPVKIFTPDSWWIFSRQVNDEWLQNHPEVIAARQKELEESASKK